MAFIVVERNELYYFGPKNMSNLIHTPTGPLIPWITPIEDNKALDKKIVSTRRELGY